MRWSHRIEQHGHMISRRFASPLILLIAFGLRVFRLDASNLWWDEALAIWAVRKGFVGVTLWTASDVHPPLYFWSLWSWVQIAGESEFAMRLLSVAMGVLTVAVVYRLGLLLGGHLVATLASLLTALSRFHIWWSQEMRMYVLAGLMGALSLYFFLRWLRALRRSPEKETGEKPHKLLVAYVLFSLGGLYTIFLMGAWLLVQNLIVGVAWLWPGAYRRKPLLLQWVASQIAILAGLALWLTVSWERMPTWSVAQSVSPTFIAQLYGVLLVAGASLHIDRYLWTLILPLIALVLGAAMLILRLVRREIDGQRGFDLATLLLAVIVPPVIVYISTLPRSLFYTPHIEARYFLPFAPVFWVLLAWAIIETGHRWRIIALVMTIGLIAIWGVVLPEHYTDRYRHDELQTMVRAIVSQAEPGDIVLLDSGGRYPVFLYHYERVRAEFRPEMETVTRGEGQLTPGEVADWMAVHAGADTRVWLAEVDANLTDPDRLVRQALEEHYKTLWAESYDHNALYLFAPTDTPPPATNPGYIPDESITEGRFANLLRGWELPVRVFTPGRQMRVVLYWEHAPEQPIMLELVNRHGQVIFGFPVATESHDSPWRERLDIPVTPTLSAGRYQLRLTLADDQHVLLTHVRVDNPQHMPNPQGPAVTLQVIWEETFVLEGLSLGDAQDYNSVAITPGETFLVDLYWHALQAPEADYTVFTHLVGEAFNPATQGPVWGQHDAAPVEGTWPTGEWTGGETVIDRHPILVDPAAPEGTYHLQIGLYATETGERLEVFEDDQALGDHLSLSIPVEVRPH